MACLSVGSTGQNPYHFLPQAKSQPAPAGTAPAEGTSTSRREAHTITIIMEVVAVPCLIF